METIYYNIDVKQLRVHEENAAERASGGQETVYCVRSQRKRAEPLQPEGKLLDIEDYRSPIPEELVDEEESTASPEIESQKRNLFGSTFDICSTVAVVCVVVGVLVRIFLL